MTRRQLPFSNPLYNNFTLYIFPGGFNTNVYDPPMPPPTGDSDGGSNGSEGGYGGADQHDDSQCSSCSSGMPAWSVSQPFSALWLRDEPLGYQPSVGPRISFKLAFKQSEKVAGYDTNIFSVGKKWNCLWLSFVSTNVWGSNVVYFPGGRQRTFPATTDYLTNTRLTGDVNNGFSLAYPDGSQNVYGLIVNNSSGSFQKAFLTQIKNAKGQQITLNYQACDPANPVVRLLYVIDGDGRTNFIYYANNNSYSTNLVSQVVDPLSRTIFLSYDSNGRLTNSMDVQGISSSFTYDTNNYVSSMTTPYGTTAFQIAEDVEQPGILHDLLIQRSVLITQPDGGQQLYLYQNNNPNLPYLGQPPSTSPFANTFNNNSLNYYNSFYWGPRQYAALSTTNISAFTIYDFQIAQMRNWLAEQYALPNGLGFVFYLTGTLNMTRDPSPDSGGTIKGQETWYDYAGKIWNYNIGTQSLPLFVARTLPDGTSSFTRTDRNSLGAVTSEISTYSVNGTVLLRTNSYTYDANGIDLTASQNALGVTVSSSSFNSNHQVITNYNALNERTVYTYDSSNRLASTKAPNGLVSTNIYGTDGLLAQQIVVGFSTNSYTYTNNLVLTHTDPRGLTTTNTWDNLNRLTSTIFPDGTYISNQYTALDLSGIRDRLGNWTFYGYDNLRRKMRKPMYWAPLRFMTTAPAVRWIRFWMRGTISRNLFMTIRAI